MISDKAVRNELRKLIAAFCNGVGIGMITTGVFTPIFAIVLNTSQKTMIDKGLVSLFVFVVAVSGFGCWAIGRLWLLRYEP
ncbi:hypothetical protein ACVI1L_000672 [Bradyrhizobium sp. USDA 4516]